MMKYKREKHYYYNCLGDMIYFSFFPRNKGDVAKVDRGIEPLP